MDVEYMTTEDEEPNIPHDQVVPRYLHRQDEVEQGCDQVEHQLDEACDLDSFCSDIFVERNEVQDPFVELRFELADRKKQFAKFKLVVIDNEELEEKFSKEYMEGNHKSQEPLFQAYCMLRKKAESSVEDALDDTLKKAISRG